MKQQPVVAVFGSSTTSRNSVEWREAEEVGALLAGAGAAVLTGGYGGTMEAVSKGAAEAGGHVIGVTVPTLFPGRSGANPHVAETIEATSLTDRLGHIFRAADGAIALAGSIGTATELMLAWNINYVARHNEGSPLPFVAVGSEWREVARTLAAVVGADTTDIHFEETGVLAARWMLTQIEIP